MQFPLETRKAVIAAIQGQVTKFKSPMLMTEILFSAVQDVVGDGGQTHMLLCRMADKGLLVNHPNSSSYICSPKLAWLGEQETKAAALILFNDYKRLVRQSYTSEKKAALGKAYDNLYFAIKPLIYK